MPLTRRTSITGILYALTFILAYIPLGLTAIISHTTGSKTRQRLTVVVATVTPLQGFFNMLIYTSPTWMAYLQKQKKTNARSNETYRNKMLLYLLLLLCMWY